MNIDFPAASGHGSAAVSWPPRVAQSSLANPWFSSKHEPHTSGILNVLLVCFSMGRSRLLETVDLDLTHSTTVQFTIRVGSTHSSCPPPSDNTENVFLQYSANGGITWILLLTVQYNALPSLESYNVTFPSDSKTASTRIRWYQPIASGSDLGVWAIDDVAIDSVASSLPCASSPCLNHGSCTNALDGTYNCQCPLGFIGKTCQIAQHCNTNPCLNGGSCTNYPTMFRCSCVQGFTGNNCETGIDECSSNPCKNRAICHDLVNDYRCSCVHGFTGKKCETDIDECSTDPCKNNATCHDLNNNYHCDCVVGYSGKNCTQYRGACGSNPCQNQAVCSDLADGNFLCACSDKFGGTLCESRSDKSSGGVSVAVYTVSVVVLIVCLLVAVVWIYKRWKARQGVEVSKVETVSQIQNPLYFAQDAPDSPTAADSCNVEQVAASGPKVDTETKQHTDSPIASNIYENVSVIRPSGARNLAQTSGPIYHAIK